MNLLHTPWLPIRRASTGQRDWIAPYQLSDPDVLTFDASRADFNGALLQFAIGLLQTATPVDSPMQWDKCFTAPPDADELIRWFKPLESAFILNGAGPRFLQDLSLQPDEGATNEIAGLLIEAPGEQTLKNNADHFIKRDHVKGLCPDCTATALLTLQINAPSGGAGHRTGLRGGGPLTTLVCRRPARSLWHDLWLNVREQRRFLSQSGEVSKTAPHFTFPWLADITAIQPDKGQTAPVQVHPAHVFWAMPRRIRIDFEHTESGACGICGRTSERLVSHYVTKNYGLNYKGPWEHPLSPYYENKEEWLPLHPQPGGLGYRNWLAWILGMPTDGKQRKAAQTVTHHLGRRSPVLRGVGLGLHAFGYDMDNMKARCWYESTLPTYGLTDCEPAARERVQAEVALWLAGAELAATCLRGAVKDAWFSGDARGDFSMIDASFWSATESAFYDVLNTLIEALRDGQDFDELEARQGFHKTLKQQATALFDQHFVGSGAVERQRPRLIAAAYRQLRTNLNGPKLRKALGLPRPAKKQGKQPAQASA
ncbi:MAG: type I-E CRISPR-associated protein Cse1/CasA [Panacagrimonas sp.]